MIFRHGKLAAVKGPRTQHNHFQTLESIATFSKLGSETLIGLPLAGMFLSAKTFGDGHSQETQ
jgi:hypothetical protein